MRRVDERSWRPGRCSCSFFFRCLERNNGDTSSTPPTKPATTAFRLPRAGLSVWRRKRLSLELLRPGVVSEQGHRAGHQGARREHARRGE